MSRILIVKTGALGDVVRTTAILPGLHERERGARVTWLTAENAVDLVRLHPLIAEVVAVDPRSAERCAAAAAALARQRFDWTLSLDDEEPLCALAGAVPTAKLSGAHLDREGRRVYTRDVAPWFDMGLLSVHGKAVADRLKLENRRTHAEIVTSMLGVPFGRPRLEIEPRHAEFARERARRAGLGRRGPVIGLNTGAGGRWPSKMLSVERTVEVALALDRALESRVEFVLFGGPDERERNAGLAAALATRVRLCDAGVDNDVLQFAALIGLCDLVITSDSLALHIALARGVRTVAFFAPTPAAEIDVFGIGEKVVSTAPDAGSFRPDADTSTLTAERIAAAALRQLAQARGASPKA